MICRGQLGQKLGGEETQGEGWGLQENKLVLAVFLASALLLAGQLHNPLEAPLFTILLPRRQDFQTSTKSYGSCYS